MLMLPSFPFKYMCILISSSRPFIVQFLLKPGCCEYFHKLAENEVLLIVPSLGHPALSFQFRVPAFKGSEWAF